MNRLVRLEFDPVNVWKPVSKGLQVTDLEPGKTYRLTSYHMGYRSYRQYKAIFKGLSGISAQFVIDVSAEGNVMSESLQIKGKYLVERIVTSLGFGQDAPTSTKDWKVVVTGD